ncbi:MAG: hypothetical protein NC393_09525 [Clostridium sp.]|nr:hypothetical protein [Clostridium sp.]
MMQHLMWIYFTVGNVKRGRWKDDDKMGVHINKNDKIVEWNVGEKTIRIHNEYVLYAFEHGRNMLMIKEKHEALESGFSTYDREGNLVFSYKYLGNHIKFKNKDISPINGSVISVDYEEEKGKLVVLKEYDEIRSIVIYDENSDALKEINCPRGYVFVSLKNNAGNIMVATHGTNDLTRDSFGRNDWNFAINFENFSVERKSIIQ